MRKTLACAALLVAALSALTACGGDEASTTVQSEARFNDADVAFAQKMIPHHQQAVQMARMAEDRASSQEVKQLAADIEAAQGPEIEQMTQWLEDWDAEQPSGSMGHGGHGDSGDGMPGMMDEQDMAMLENASGAEFDRMFLTSIIKHHEGAIEMARTEQANGVNPEAVALAEKIETDQKAEIIRIQELLKR